MNAPTTEPVTPSITPAVTPSFEGGGEINGLTAEEAFYLWVKRGLKQPAREKYLRPLGLFNTDKSKAVEEKLKKIYALNGVGAITEQGKELARQIDNATTGKLSRLHTAMDFIGKFNELKDSFGKTKFEHGGEVSVLRTRVKIIKTKLKSDKNNSVLKTRLKLVQKMLEGNSINRQQTESTADNLQPTNEDKEWVKRGEAFWNDARKNAKKLSEMSHNEFNDWMVENHFGFYKDNVTTLRYVSPSAEDDAIERLQNQVKGFVKENVRDSRTQEKIEQPQSLSYGRDDYEQAVYDFADTLSENARSHARQALLSSKPFIVREKNEFQNITEKKQRFVIADFVLSNFLAGATIKPFSNSMAMTNALYPTTSILQGNFGGALPKIAFDFFRFLQTHKPEAPNQFIKNPKYNPYDKEETAEYLHMAHVTGDTKAFSENVMALVEKHKPELIAAINKLTPYAEIKDVKVYGSIAEGRAKQGSDIDLKVVYTKINDGFTDVDLKDDLYGKLGVPEIAGAFDIGVEEYFEPEPEELDTTPKVLKYAYEIGDDVVFYAAGNELVKAKIKIPSTISDDGVQVWLTNRGYKREDEMLPAIVSAAQTSSGGGYKMFKGIGGSKYYEVKFADGDKFTSYRSDRASAIDEAIKHRLYQAKDYPKTKFENPLIGADDNGFVFYSRNELEKMSVQRIEELSEQGFKPISDVLPVVTEKDYFMATTAMFEKIDCLDFDIVDAPIVESPNVPVIGFQSQYKYSNGFLYRKADHWKTVGSFNCGWAITPEAENGEVVCGRVKFSDMKRISDGGIIFIKNKLASGGAVAAPLLAPNGQPSNLNPIQYALVRTPEFKAWFGDWEKLALLPQIDSGIDEVSLSNLSKEVSKVVDENGEPLVVYHGSATDITEFKPQKVRYGNHKTQSAHFFTDNIEIAKAYSQLSSLEYDEWGQRKIGAIMECFISSKNPKQINANNQPLTKYVTDTEIKAIIKENDAIIVKNAIDAPSGKFYETPQTIIICFLSNQIKLADGTNQTFEGSNADIRYAIGGAIDGMALPIMTIPTTVTA